MTTVADVMGYYMDGLLEGILVSADPRIATREYIKKKRLYRRFGDLLELENALRGKEDEILEKMLSVLPEVTVKEEYIKAQKKIVEIIMEYLSDKLKKLEEYINYINRPEFERSLKVAMRKQKHLLGSLREDLAELIIENPTEDKIVVDQALSLAMRLYDKLIQEPDNLSTSVYLLILLLRIIGVSKGKFDYEILYEDIAEISSELESEGEIPQEILEVLDLDI